MALYMIGLGLADAKDISLKGLEALKKCDIVYLESYTSLLQCKKEELEQLYGKTIILAGRELVEKGEDKIIHEAEKEDVAFLVVGDVFSATTHISLYAAAKKAGLKVIVVHNASVLTAIGITGLEIYKFGRTASIPFHHSSVTSPLEIFRQNQKHDLHTLFLLDLDPIKQKYLSIAEAADYLLSNHIDNTMLAVACAGLGSEQPEIKALHLKKLASETFTLFPQCLIIPAKTLHFMEEEALKMWS